MTSRWVTSGSEHRGSEGVKGDYSLSFHTITLVVSVLWVGERSEALQKIQ